MELIYAAVLSAGAEDSWSEKPLTLALDPATEA